MMTLIDYFVFEQFGDDADQLYKARTLAGILLVFAILLSISCLYLFFWSPLSRESVYFALILTSVLVAAYTGVLFFLKWRGWYELCTHLVVLSTFASIAMGIFMTGGPMASPANQVVVIPPIMAFCLGGRRAGLFWSHLVFFSQIIMVLMDHFEFVFPQLMDLQHLKVNQVFNWALSYGAIIGVILVYETINHRLKKERDAERNRYAFLAKHDPLTSLANRSLFDEHLDKSLRRCQGRDDKVVLIFIDLDGFKPINDDIGHDAGDVVLQAIGGRLVKTTRKSDLVARLGGDEFAVVLSGIEDVQHITTVADKLLQAIAKPIVELGDEICVTGSVGVAIYPDQASSSDELRKCADLSMYRAKDGHNQWCLYDVSLDGDAVCATSAV